MASDKVLKLTQGNFDTEVLKSSIPVLVDFWASWCGPCMMVGPIINELADEFAGSVKVGKVNVDEEGSLAQEYDIMTIPTVILFKNGEIIEQSVGAKVKDAFIDMINIAL